MKTKLLKRLREEANSDCEIERVPSPWHTYLYYFYCWDMGEEDLDDTGPDNYPLRKIYRSFDTLFTPVNVIMYAFRLWQNNRILRRVRELREAWNKPSKAKVIV